MAEGLTVNMAAEGLTNDLLLAAFTVWLLGLWICSRDLPLPVALVVTSIKVAIPVVYFAWFFDGTWTLGDDLVYLSRGSEMLQSGQTPIEALISAKGGYSWIMSTGFYEWWNLLSQWLFGEHYYAPVLLNVFLTFAGGHFLCKLARLGGFSEGYARGLLLFFLFQWEVLVWASFTNLKDTLVMTLTIMGFYFILKLSERVSFGGLFALGLICLILGGIRAYTPAIMITAVVLWGILYLRGSRRYLLLLGCLIGSLGMVEVLGLQSLLSYSLQFVRGSVVFGASRTLLSPQPWSISPQYSFLLLPSVLHWLLLLPALLGGWMLWRQSRESALLLIYAALLLLVYGFVPEQQEPRHRFQITFVVAWMQFHFFWVMVREAVSRAALVRKADTVHEGKV